MIIGLFLVCAAITPFMFLDYPDDDTLRKLTLVYEFNEVIRNNETVLSDEYRHDVLTYYTSVNNMRPVLKSQSYNEFPLMVDVYSWNLSEIVDIGMQSVEINASDMIFGYDCWICKLDNVSVAAYDKTSGIFVYSELDSLNIFRAITLLEMGFEESGPLRVKQSGVLLTGIFVELAVVAWLIADRSKKPSDSTFGKHI